MEENELISVILNRQKELEVALVNGVPDWEAYIRVVNQYRGLEEAKSLIHDAYIRLNNGDSIDADNQEEV